MSDRWIPLGERLNDATDGNAWSAFETELFNLFTQHTDARPELLFSGRLRVVNVMLEAMHRELETIEREQKGIVQ